jgi:hypothetical protein
MKNHIIIIFAVLGIALFTACEGKQGPVGPAGEPGPGTRIVYQSTTPIAKNFAICVDVPEITLDDMPLVSVYVAHREVPSLWTELPAYFENFPDFGLYCCYFEGEVCFDQCKDFYYKIVIVK